MQANRHVPGKAFFSGLKARWRGHDHDDGVHGNANALPRFLDWAMTWAVNGSIGVAGNGGASVGSASPGYWMPSPSSAPA
jgi:hypothetical protein